MPDARAFLTALVGKPLRTITHDAPNRVLSVEADHAIVATEDSPAGAPVRIARVQEAIDALYRDGELRVNKATLGHRRTAFIGAALRELPNVEALKGPPGQRLRVRR